LYTITLLRKYEKPSCETQWDYEKKMPCIPTEFIAIAFSNGSNTNDDYWYTCVAGEPTVTYWQATQDDTGGSPHEPIHVKDTRPYYSIAPGVIATTHIKLDPLDRSFGCQFILSAKFMKADNLANAKFPLPGEASNNTQISIKVVQGQVIRSVQTIPPDLQAKLNYQIDFEPNLADRSPDVVDYYKSQQSLHHPVFQSDSAAPDSEYLKAETFTGVDEKNILFSQLAVMTEKSFQEPHTPSDQVQNDIDEVVAKCGKGSVRCYAPNGQRNCIYRGRCPVMVIVEPLSDYQELHFRLISFRADDKTVKRVVRPFGYASIGFSKDGNNTNKLQNHTSPYDTQYSNFVVLSSLCQFLEKMGEDLVVACVFSENKNDIIVSWNNHHANLVDLEINQDLIYDKKPIKYIRRAESDTIFCEWKMKSEFDMKLRPYFPNPNGQPLKPELVYFNFMQSSDEEKTFILIASGTSVYENYRMGYHNFRQNLLNQYLSRDYFSLGVRDDPSPRHHFPFIIILASISQFLMALFVLL
jgi:hypothetical protein